jgi:hypothetical protein
MNKFQTLATCSGYGARLPEAANLAEMQVIVKLTVIKKNLILNM